MNYGFYLLLFILTYGEAVPSMAVTPVTPGAAKESFAFDTIAGDLPGVVLAGAKPYIVAGDIYVPQGKTVIIEAGAIFLFKNFTGLHVSGILLARGIKEKPIVFTSENDRDYNKKSIIEAAPFDWNGVYVHEDGMSSHFAYCAVLYSVEGMSSLTKFIRINTCLFLHNGRANLTIEGKQFPVTTRPYDYAMSANDPSLLKIPTNILKDPHAKSRFTIRIAGIAAASMGGVAGIIWGNSFAESSRDFQNKSSLDENNLSRNSSDAWGRARMDKNKDFAMLATGCTIAVLGAIGILWTFTF